MLATLLIEFGAAIYTIWRYKLTAPTRLILALFIGLGTFQLAEYFVCTGYYGHETVWSRIGFVAITTLPPLGLHLMHTLAGKAQRKLVYAGYATMAAFIAFFLFSNAFTGHQCTGNYVIFQFTEGVTGTYGVYYFGWILTAIGLGLNWAGELKAQGKKQLAKLRTVQGLIAGYLIFLVPAGVSAIIQPATLRGIPSVLCGFAVLLALVLLLYVLPRVGQRRKA